MHFPVSGIDAPLWLPPLVAFGISFFTSMAGISGAFLLLPFQMSVLGYVAPSVSATNHVFNIVATPGGVYRYVREQRMVWPLAWAVLIGTLPGVFLGTWIRIRWIPDPRSFKLFVGCVLLYIGLRLILDLVRGGRRGSTSITGARIEGTRVSLRRIEYRFGGETHAFHPAGILALCFAVGLIGGTYGIGGGSVVAPFLVSILHLPIHTIAGATLLGTFATSLAGVGFFELFQHPPDWLLGLLFGAGGFCGIYLGARCQRHFRPGWIKGILCACILFVGLRYVLGYFSG